MNPQSRDFSLDAIKTMAIFLVIMIHMSAPGFVSFGAQWPAATFYESISRASVPLFFMVTGATLLDKDNSISSVLRRTRVVIIPLLAWSFIYIAYNTYYYHESTHGWVRAVIQGPVRHLWYLYTLVGIYLFLPLISRFWQNATNPEKLWILAGWIIGASFMPVFRGLTNQVLIGIDMSYMPIYSGYLLLGAYLYHLAKSNTALTGIFISFLAWAGGSALTLWLTFQKTVADHHYTTIFLDYNSPTVILAAAGAFYFIVSIGKFYPKAIPNLIASSVGKRTLGIYLCHMILLDYTPRMVGWVGPMNSWAYYFLCTLLTLILSFIFVYLIQKVRYIRAICP